MSLTIRSFVFLAAGVLMLTASACSTPEKAPEETAAAVAPVIAPELAMPAPIEPPAPLIAQNDSKTKGLWGASSTGRSR